MVAMCMDLPMKYSNLRPENKGVFNVYIWSLLVYKLGVAMQDILNVLCLIDVMAIQLWDFV